MSVYKRGGVYCYDFWFQGQRHRQCTGLTNKTAALRAEAIRKAELAEGRAGIVRRKPGPTFESFVSDEFLPWSMNEHRDHPKTHLRYSTSSKPLIEFFGKFRIDAISGGLVEKFKLFRASKISNAGTNRDLAALRLILNFAIRQEYLGANPVCAVSFLPEGAGMIRIVSHEEQQKYLAVANPLVRDVAMVMLETGMRPGEVFAIRRENVHLSKCFLFVPEGKTRFARRNAPLTNSTMEILRRRMETAKGPYLFPHRLDPNKPLTDLQVGHRTALRDAKIKPEFRLYDLRHSFGSRAAMAGVDLATLKELMGHSTISMTMRYVHPTPEHKRSAIEKLVLFNAEQEIARFERPGSPQKSPQLPI